MTPLQRQRVQELYNDAVARPVEKRTAYICDVCADDAIVRDAVLAQLVSLSAVTISPTDAQPNTQSSDLPMSMGRDISKGTRLGPYTLRRSLGGGGFGAVWLADRRAPDMTVAIKVLHGGTRDAKAIARFQAEAQALAMLDHECIAKIHQADFTETGEPYIAMEYVVGKRITSYCDEKGLSLEQRLELIARVCEAIHHAHARGIIHRDLKPDNILVTEVRRDPKALRGGDLLLKVGQEGDQAIIAQPKIVDFGLAKALTPNLRLADSTLTVDLGKLMGTLEYMAPEQTDHQPLSVDTRSDIFALGIVLYELITGTLPLPKEELRERAFDEAVARVRGTPRPAPSTRFSELNAEAAATAARLRGESSPANLARTLRGRLQHLPGMALRLEKERRYTSAAAFARDIRHYLASEPFEEAAAEAWSRKLWLTLQRNPLPYAAMLLIVGGLLVGFLVVTWALNAAVDARDAESHQKQLAQGLAEEKASLAAEHQAAREFAEREAGRAIRSDYASRIALAELAISSGDMYRAKRLLSECPKELRHLEWYWLVRMMDDSSVTFRYEGPYSWGRPQIEGGLVVHPAKTNILVWQENERSKPKLILKGHTNDVTALAIAKDGKRIVSGSKDMTIKVWDGINGGEPLFTLRGHYGNIECLAISDDGKRIVSGGAEGLIMLWDAVSGGSPLLKLYQPQSDNPFVQAPRVISFCVGGKRIVSGHLGGAVRVWDTTTGRESAQLTGHSGSPSAIAVSPDGDRVVVGCADRSIKVWSAEHGGDPLMSLTGHADSITALAVSADGGRLVSGSNDKTIKVWDMNDGGKLVVTLQGDEGPEYVAISQDGNQIRSAYSNLDNKLWDLNQWRSKHVTINDVYQAAMSADGKRVVCRRTGGTEFIAYDLETGESVTLSVNSFPAERPDVIDPLDIHTDWINALAIDANGSRFVTGGDDRTIKVWDARKSGPPLLTLAGHEDAVTTLVFSADGRHIISGSADKTVRVWDARRGKELCVLRGHTGGVAHVSVSASGERILSKSEDDHSARVWEWARNDVPLMVMPFNKSGADVADCCIAPDGEKIAVLEDVGTHLSFNVLEINGDRRIICQMKGADYNVNTLVFSADGRRLVTAGDGIKIWSLDHGGEPLMTWRSNTSIYSLVELSSNSRHLISIDEIETKLDVWNGASDSWPYLGEYDVPEVDLIE